MACASGEAFAGATGAVLDATAGTALGAAVAWTTAGAVADFAAECCGAFTACTQLHGCRRQSARLPAASSAATAAVPAHGSQGGVKRFPKTSEAALRTRGPVMR